ncbi:MAG TPA: hypothetical protein VM537_17080 [Anaerolineae bacterium]|nr:hypothetical protein [Anaerolineae bacterium]
MKIRIQPNRVSWEGGKLEIADIPAYEIDATSEFTLVVDELGITLEIMLVDDDDGKYIALESGLRDGTRKDLSIEAMSAKCFIIEPEATARFKYRG